MSTVLEEAVGVKRRDSIEAEWNDMSKRMITTIYNVFNKPNMASERTGKKEIRKHNWA